MHTISVMILEAASGERKKYKNMSPNVDRSTEKVIFSTAAQTYSSFLLQLSIDRYPKM